MGRTMSLALPLGFLLKGGADADTSRLAAASGGQLGAVLLHGAALDDSIALVALPARR
jgi:hypothetical protein